MNKMNRFNDSVENDSFDDILATMDVPTTVVPSTPSASSGVKKSRLSFDSDGGLSDSVLANLPMPTASTSQAPQTEKAVIVPITSSKTNCVLVNPKQRGTFHTCNSLSDAAFKSSKRNLM